MQPRNLAAYYVDDDWSGWQYETLNLCPLYSVYMKIRSKGEAKQQGACFVDYRFRADPGDAGQAAGAGIVQ